MDGHDPILQFFPDNPDIDLYAVLSVTSGATLSEIKSAYRRLALLHHPDKHVTSSSNVQKDASVRFQQVGFAYAVLGNEERRKRYDETGKTDEGMDWEKGEDGWEAYFEQMFEKVTRGKLDEMKKEYQGSAEEIADLRTAYLETGGSIEAIISRIPHSNYADEARFTDVINGLISQGELNALPAWTKGIKDEKARKSRKKKGEKEAKEAEGLAKELGVWDEFYGSGKEGKRKSKGKGQKEKSTEYEEEDNREATLKALIQGRQKKLGSIFDSLATKYGAELEPEVQGAGKGTKRRKSPKGEVNSHASPRKKVKSHLLEPDIDDEEYARVQQTLFVGKGKQRASRASKPA